jgi:N6-L-threonylcarbamoyladenine synthase
MTREFVLGIETSCDDTAAAIVAEDGRVLSSVLMSQHEIHANFGGIYPELASRAHADRVVPIVARALEEASIRPSQLRAIGVTRGPGLIGSLLVGLDAARGLGHGWGVPVIGVNHLRGHLRSADLEAKRVDYPAVVLLVSGGHTLLAFAKSSSSVQLVGSTRDDSAGEAYDKVARMLGLGFPGGPAVDRLAATGTASIPFPRPMLHDGLEFSFSGLKSAVQRFLAANPAAKHEDVAASFVESCLELLVTKSGRAIEQFSPKSFVVVGGVAASPQLRASAASLCEAKGVALCLPPLKWSTDNGAMIALAAWDYLNLGLEPAASADTTITIEDF